MYVCHRIEHFAQMAEELWQKQISWEGRIGATSSIIVANRAWIMTRERIPNDKSRAERHARQTMGRVWAWLGGARFSFSSRLGDGDVKLCAIRHGPLSISVYVMFVNWPNCRTCLSRLCGCWVVLARVTHRDRDDCFSSLLSAGILESETNATYDDERDRWWLIWRAMHDRVTVRQKHSNPSLRKIILL